MRETTSTRPFAPFEWMLSLRYLRARRQEGFISVNAGFSFLGIMLGRRHAHHRDGGDERLPQGAARQDSRPQRPPADPAAGTAAHRLGGGRRAHLPGAGRHAGRADRRGPGAGVLAVQCVGRAGARHARRRSRQAALRRQQHQAGHARRLRRRAGRGDRPAARRSVVAARGRQRHAGGSARRGDPDGHDAAHQALQGRRRVRDRHVGIRFRASCSCRSPRRRPISTAPATSPRSRSMSTIRTRSTVTAGSSPRRPAGRSS